VSITKIKITILICVSSFYLSKPPGNGIKSVYLGEIEDFDAPSSQPVDQLEYTIQGRYHASRRLVDLIPDSSINFLLVKLFFSTFKTISFKVCLRDFTSSPTSQK